MNILHPDVILEDLCKWTRKAFRSSNLFFCQLPYMQRNGMFVPFSYDAVHAAEKTSLSVQCLVVWDRHSRRNGQLDPQQCGHGISS